MKFCKVSLTSICSFLLLGFVAFAQNPTGSISGVVEDESGAGIPGARVTVTNIDQGIRRLVTTETAGRYHVPGLLPGNYEVQAQMEGSAKPREFRLAKPERIPVQWAVSGSGRSYLDHDYRFSADPVWSEVGFLSF